MGKYYCEYCDVHLNHSTTGSRRNHYEGRKHVVAKVEYWQNLMREMQLNPPVYKPPAFLAGGSMVPEDGAHNAAAEELATDQMSEIAKSQAIMAKMMPMLAAVGKLPLKHPRSKKVIKKRVVQDNDDDQEEERQKQREADAAAAKKDANGFVVKGDVNMADEKEGSDIGSDDEDWDDRAFDENDW